MRRVLQVTARCCAIAALLTSGCAAPRDPDTLRILVEKAPSSLDPRVGSDQASSRAHDLVHRGLFRIGPDLAPRGDLATSVQLVGDRQYVLELLDGATFSDGRPFSSRDVAFTIRSILEGSSPRKADVEDLAAVETPDDRHLVLTLRSPSAGFVSNLTFGIVPEGTPPDELSPPGLGPYRLEVRRGPHLVDFVRRDPVPAGAFRRITFVAVADEMARSLAIRKGDVDLVVNDLSPEVLRTVEHDPRFRAIVGDGANYQYLMLNCASPPLSDARVRRAFAMAIDRHEIVQTLLGGMGREATGLLPPESWAYHRPGEGPGYDPASAAALLDEAGFRDPDGPGPKSRLSVTFKCSSTLSSRVLAEVVQGYLRRVGVDVVIESHEWSTFFDDIRAGRFELASLVWVGISDPDALRARFHSALVPPRGLNRVRFSSPELDALLERGARELDPGARREIYAAAQELLAREVPYVSLWYKSNFALVRRGIDGVELGPFADFAMVAALRRNDAGRSSRVR